MNWCDEENFLRVRHYDWVIVVKSQDRRASIATISNDEYLVSRFKEATYNAERVLEMFNRWTASSYKE